MWLLKDCSFVMQEAKKSNELFTVNWIASAEIPAELIMYFFQTAELK